MITASIWIVLDGIVAPLGTSMRSLENRAAKMRVRRTNAIGEADRRRTANQKRRRSKR